MRSNRSRAKDDYAIAVHTVAERVASLMLERTEKQIQSGSVLRSVKDKANREDEPMN